MMVCSAEYGQYNTAYRKREARFSRYSEYREECITEYYRQECLMAFYRLESEDTRPIKKRKRRCVTFAEHHEIVGIADADVDRSPVPTASITREEMKLLLEERVFPKYNHP
ncbi:hypothetical protein THRCLA_20944 [Thraustotheca clavata]|uniref:Uncharacterized protein n=1 Tax=Thraustotheca clavata TaxID=74557 RepID=A0A1W0A1R1_9STRA|nr:hypothetical protein THRCLA_20944 [Thraustotheca clavata]